MGLKRYGIDYGDTVAYKGHTWTVITIWDTVYDHVGLVLGRQKNEHGDGVWTMTFSNKVKIVEES